MTGRRIAVCSIDIVSAASLIVFAALFRGYMFEGDPNWIVLLLVGFACLSLSGAAVFATVFSLRGCPKKERVVSTAICCVLLTSLALAPNAVTVASFGNMVSFSEAKWTQIEPKYKYYMAKDYIDRNLFSGLNRDEIKAQLGEPTYEAPDDGGLTTLEYECGIPVRKFAIDPYFLSVYFGDDGVALKATLVER